MVVAIYTQPLYVFPLGLNYFYSSGVLEMHSEHRAWGSQSSQGTVQSEFNSAVRTRGCFAGKDVAVFAGEAESSLLDCPANIWALLFSFDLPLPRR